MRLHQPGYTQTDVEVFDKVPLEREELRSYREERRYNRGQYTVEQPNQGGGNNTVKTKNHPEYK